MKALLNITPIFLAPLANSFKTIKTTTTTRKQISFLFLVQFFFLLCHLLKAVDISFSSLYFTDIHSQYSCLYVKKKNPSLLEKQLRHWRLYYPGGAVSLLAWKAPANSSQTNDRNVTCWRMCTFLVQNTGQVGLTAVSPDSFIALG